MCRLYTGKNGNYIRLCSRTGRKGERIHTTENAHTGCVGKQSSSQRSQKRYTVTLYSALPIAAADAAEMARYGDARHTIDTVRNCVTFFLERGVWDGFLRRANSLGWYEKLNGTAEEE